MPKYHDQEYIKTVCRKIQNETVENVSAITEQLKDLKVIAQQDVNRISVYTAPEEAERRRQYLYYYIDLLDELAK